MKPLQCCTLFFLFSQLATAQRLQLNTDSTRGFHFSISQLEKNLTRSFTDSAAGWAFSVWKAGKPVAEKSGGYKIRPSDTRNGEGAVFSTDSRMHIASLSKSITALAIAKLVDMKKIGWNSPVKPFLPSYWNLHPSFAKMTIREIVMMTTGLDRPLDAVTSGYDSLQKILERGPNPDKTGKFNYQNTGYGVLRIVIAYLSGFRELSPAVPHHVSAVAISRLYEKFVNEYLLQPAGITHAACAETETEPVLRYSFPPDSLPGVLTGSDDGSLALTAGGFGWYLSVTDIGKLLNAVFYTKKIISPSILHELVDMEFPFRIRQFTYGNYFGTGGDWGAPLKPTGWAGIHTYFICFPGDVHVIAFTNSGEGSLGPKIMRAFRNSFLPD